MLLIGAVPQPITSAPLAIFVYAVLVLMVAGALATVALRRAPYAIAAFITTMVMVALLYLVIAPFPLFLIQLLVFAVASATLLLGLLRQTTGLERPPHSPLSREWMAGGIVSAAMLALLGVVMAATSWPVKATGTSPVGFGEALTTTYLVGLAIAVLILASAAVGVGLLLAAPQHRARVHRAEPSEAERGRGSRRSAR